MERGALYIRVSTDEQTEYSPTAQKNALLKYAKNNNILIDDDAIFIDEGISGKKAEKRPSFMKMISIAKKKPKPFDVILVHKFDRFARNREDSVVYKSLLRKDCGIKVISITEHIEDDKFSIILESMLEAMAEYYSLNLADEVKKGLFEKAKRGEPIGNAPYGYQLKNKTLIEKPKQIEAVKIIYDKFVNEDWSLLQIARYLNTLGHTTKYSKQFTKRPIKYILQNPVYHGYNRYNYRKNSGSVYNDPDDWIIAKGNHKPIIDEDTYIKAQDKLKKNSILQRKEGNGELKHWLQKILRCAHCNSTMRLHTSNGYYYYRCEKAYQGGCTCTKTLSAIKLSKIILNTIQYDIENFKSLHIEEIKNNNQMNTLDKLKRQLKNVESKYDLARRAYLAQIDTLEDYKRNKELIQEEENKIKHEIDSINSSTSKKMNKTTLKNYFKLISDESSSPSARNNVAKKFISQINIDLISKELDINYYV